LSAVGPFTLLMDPKKNFREFIEFCLLRKVEFLIVGGFSLQAHGAPRFTEDIDLFVKISDENATKLFAVLEDFGFGKIGINREDFLEPGQVVQLGRPPERIDILTSISGVTWDEAWKSRVPIEIFGHNCFAIGREELLRNKMASGRPQDMWDVERLRSGSTAGPSAQPSSLRRTPRSSQARPSTRRPKSPSSKSKHRASR
jgi:hypothetical protein